VIEEGAALPDVTLSDEKGPVRLAEFEGAKTVVYFYPKDDTSGCTREALDFTELAGRFEAAGVTVLGVSRDTVASHGKFTAKHSLAVRLLSDEAGAASEAFGTWVEKSMYGRKYMGLERSTFLFGADGRLAKSWRKVKVPGHAAAVLKAAETL